MAFADAFSTENMNKLMQDPKLMLGLALMAQGRQGSGAQALGQAGLPAVQMINQQQNQAQLQQYRQQMIQADEQQRAFQIQQAQAKAEQQQRQQAAFQDPALQAQLGPMAKYLAQAGIDPDTILKANSGEALQQHRAAQLAQQQAHFAQTQARIGAGGGGGQPPGPKVPTPRMTLDEPLGDGMVQRHKFDASTGSYVPFGKPFRQFAPTKADPLQSLIGEVMPDDNAGAGPAVPGLPGSNASSTPPPSGAGLLMHGAGSNPMARPPAQTNAAAAPTGDLAAAKSAIAAGKSRQAVVARLTQAGYTPAQIQAAGI